MRNKKLQIWLPLLFSLVMILGMLIGYRLKENTHTAASFFHVNKSAVQQVIDLINLKYVDKISTDTMEGEAMQVILDKLDPHSIYIPPVELEEVNEDLQGNFQGIGVEYHIFHDTVNVVNVLQNGPSEKAGLLAGDQFLKVEGAPVAGTHITNEQIRKFLRGPASSQVAVTVLREGQQKQFAIKRGTIPLPSVEVAYMLDKQTGFIKISKFSQTTYREFMQALEKLQAKGLTRLIVDLRGNGGGILQEAVEIADEFLDEDKLIVYTKGDKTRREEYKGKRPGLFESGKLEVLTDEGSASASEILAGALQDWDRATIIGRRTFGKGLVQEQYDLTNGAALRLTVARYYTPSGRSIQKPYRGSSDYHQEIMERYKHGAFVSADSNKVTSGQAYKTSKGKTVYGGGGIMPDVFVSLDTSLFSPALSKLYLSTTLSNFVYSYYLEHRDQFKQYRTVDDFVKGFTQGEEIWKGLVPFAAKDSIELNRLTPAEKEIAQQRVRAMFARQLWRNEGFYEVYNLTDPVVKKALELMNK